MWPNTPHTPQPPLVSSSVIPPPCSSPPWPPTSLSLCGPVGQAVRPAAGALSPGLDLEHGCFRLSRIQAPWGLEEWEQRVEGRGGGVGGGREESSSIGSEQYSSGSPSKSSNPNGETGFLCGESERKGGGYGGREREKDMGDKRQGESVKRKMKKMVWVRTSFSLCFSLPLSPWHACTCPSYSWLHWDDLSVCWSRETWEIWPAQRRRCASLELPLGAGVCVYVYWCLCVWQGGVGVLPSQAPPPTYQKVLLRQMYTHTPKCTSKIPRTLQNQIQESHSCACSVYHSSSATISFLYPPESYLLNIQYKILCDNFRNLIFVPAVVHIHFFVNVMASSAIYGLCTCMCVSMCASVTDLHPESGSAVCLASIRGSVFLNASVKGELTCSGTFPPAYYYTQHLSWSSLSACLFMCISSYVCRHTYKCMCA